MDLTKDNPQTVLWKFCLPLFGSVIFQQLYNIADSLVAGKFIGEQALAAVGNSYEITLIFIAFAFGCNMGCSVVVSQLFGAKKLEDMKSAVSTACIFSGLVCITLMLLGITLGDAILYAIKTPQEVYFDSKLYLDIYIWGLPFVFFYNIATGIFSALGDSKTPFYFLAVSSTANILVDIWFVKSFQMGVSGVAWATFLCQGISCMAALIAVFNRLRRLTENKSFQWFRTDLLKKIVAIALPSTLQQSFISVGNIIIQGVINGFGPSVMAGYSAGVKLNNLVITSFTTLGNGISNYAGQNLGAGKPERIKSGFVAGIKMVWMLSLPLCLLYMIGCKYLLLLFMDQPTQKALATGMIFLRILAPFYFVVSAKLISDGILRGSGMMGKFMIGTFADLILRVVLAIIFSKTMLMETGIWCAWPVGWSIATIISLIFFWGTYGKSNKMGIENSKSCKK